MRLCLCSFIAALCVGVVPAHAALIVFQTPSGSTTGGQPVSASATFATSADHVTIVLQNLQVDPKSVTQAISGLKFSLSPDTHTGASISSSSGKDRSVMSSGTYNDGAITATGWELSTKQSTIELSVLGTQTAPNHTILGPPNSSTDKYSNANSSIKSGPHNPFIGLSATFDLYVPNVTSASAVSSVTFLFNTAPGNSVSGDDVTGSVPEPAALCGLIGLAGLVAGSSRRRR